MVLDYQPADVQPGCSFEHNASTGTALPVHRKCVAVKSEGSEECES